MSQWHREHPELAGHPDYDPWMQNEGYRKVAPVSEAEREMLADEAREYREQERRERMEREA